MKEKIMKDLTIIFRSNFDDETIVISNQTTAEDIEYWDSLEQINLVLACERKWGVKFELEEMATMKNVGEMVEMIIKKIS